MTRRDSHQIPIFHWKSIWAYVFLVQIDPGQPHVTPKNAVPPGRPESISLDKTKYKVDFQWVPGTYWGAALEINNILCFPSRDGPWPPPRDPEKTAPRARPGSKTTHTCSAILISSENHDSTGNRTSSCVFLCEIAPGRDQLGAGHPTCRLPEIANGVVIPRGDSVSRWDHEFHWNSQILWNIHSRLLILLPAGHPKRQLKHFFL